jgi:hypothetical protein
LAHLLRKNKNRDEEESGKRILGLMAVRKKGAHFFRQGVLRKMYGCKAAKKKETEKD